MSYCRELTAVNQKPTEGVAISLPCRAWTCPDCAPQRKRQVIAQGIAGKPRLFLTLTTRSDDHSDPNAAALEISRAWRLLRLRIMRRYKLKSLPFLCVFEKHVSGWPHLHLLLRFSFIPHWWLSNQWLNITGSPVVWIEALDSAHKGAIYCAKYCGKCTQKLGTAKRYWQSQDYDLRPEEEKKWKKAKGGGWTVDMSPLSTIISWWKQLGYTIKREGYHRASYEHSYEPGAP